MINVLSLFDGMSCGQIALRELGIEIGTYYASEIDKHAIKQTQLNFPQTVQLGDVQQIDGTKLGHIDLLIGGSPCTNLSFVGKRAGLSTVDKVDITTLDQYEDLKLLGFEFEGQSYLFWEYMRILNELMQVNPNVKFMLENVEMGKKWEKIFNEAVGVNGVHINSALVSAQNRKRIYWANFDVTQPEDRRILLRDILESEVSEKYYLSEKMIEWLDRHDRKSIKKGNGFRLNIKKGDEKGCCLSSGVFKQNLSADYVFGLSNQKSNRIRRLTPTECARLQTIPSWYQWVCSDTQQYRMLGNGWTVEVIKHIFQCVEF